MSFSRGSSWPRDQSQVSRIAGRRFTTWATREATVCMHHVLFFHSSISKHLGCFCFLAIRIMLLWIGCWLLLLSHSVVSSSLQHQRLQHASLPCPLLKFSQTLVHWVTDAIQPSRLLLCPSPPTLTFPACRSFLWVSSLHQMAKVWNGYINILFKFLLCYCFQFILLPESGLLDYIVFLFVIFWETVILFFIMAWVFLFKYKDSNFNRSLPNSYYFGFCFVFYKSNPNRYEVVSQCDFDFPND